MEKAQLAVGWGDFVDEVLGVDDVVEDEPEEDESLDVEVVEAAGASLEVDAAGASDEACLPRLSLR